jgi:hypothetical protein
MKHRDEFPQFLNSLNLTGKGVEVGSFQGWYANHILKNWSGTLYMVDVWRELSDKEYNDSSNMKFHSPTYTEAIQNIDGFEKRALMMRMESEQASEMFPDKSLDFVYIDANHTYEHVKQDIRLWSPKVKIGGILAGHDYLLTDSYNKQAYENGLKNQHIWMWSNQNPENQTYAGLFGVNPAVEEFCEEFGYPLNHTEEWTSTWWVIKK